MAELKQGEKTVTTGGTEEPLVATSTLAHWVIIQGMASNTNNAYIGEDGEDPKAGGLELDALQMTPRLMGSPLDLALIEVDVDTDGEGVNFIYWSYP